MTHAAGACDTPAHVHIAFMQDGWMNMCDEFTKSGEQYMTTELERQRVTFITLHFSIFSKAFVTPAENEKK